MPKPSPIVPSAPPPSRKPRKKPKAKSGPEASADIDDVDLPIATAPGLIADAPEAERPSVLGKLILSRSDLINERTDEVIENPRDRKRGKSEGVGAAQIEVAPRQPYPQLQKTCVTRTVDLLDVLRFSLKASGRLDALLTCKGEGSTIYSVADALLGTDDEKRRAAVEGFLQGSGDFEGLSYTLLVGIAKAGLALPHTPAPPLAEELKEAVGSEDEQNSQEDEQRQWRREVAEEKPAVWKSREQEPSSSGVKAASLVLPRAPAPLAEEEMLKSAAEAERKKRDKERRKREEEEKRRQTQQRVMDRLRRDRAEGIRKKHEEERHKRQELEEQRERELEERRKREEKQWLLEAEREWWLEEKRRKREEKLEARREWLEEEQRERELEELIWMVQEWSPGMPMSLRMHDLLDKYFPVV